MANTKGDIKCMLCGRISGELNRQSVKLLPNAPVWYVIERFAVVSVAATCTVISSLSWWTRHQRLMTSRQSGPNHPQTQRYDRGEVIPKETLVYRHPTVVSG